MQHQKLCCSACSAEDAVILLDGARKALLMILNASGSSLKSGD